jgi:hypothetical protein
MDHCLRSCLPTSLFVELKAQFLDLHRQTLARVDALYGEMKAGAIDYLIDVHTMASFCPVDGNGTRYILPVSFQRLEDYVTQFIEARDHKYRRSIDLITADDHGQRWADAKLVQAIQEGLHADGYPQLENVPYCASAAFLSGQHLRSVPSISLDVPKHLLSSWADDFTDYQLDDVPLSADRIDRLGACLARAIHAALSISA